MTHSQPSRTALALACSLVVAVLLSVWPAQAAAGEYTVIACHPGFAGGANRSWSPEIAHGGMTAYPRCPGADQNWNEGLVSRHATVAGNSFATVPQYAYAGWVFRAPSGTAIVRGTYEHNFCSGEGDYHAGLYGGASQHLHVETATCNSYPSPRTMDFGGTDALRLLTVCAKSTCNVGRGLIGHATLRSVVITLRDDLSPSVEPPGGPLVDGRWHRDSSSIHTAASDNVGVGLMESFVDGQFTGSRRASCDDPTLPVRCPDFVQAVGVDLLRVADGRHQISARATDVTGNIALSASRSILVDNTAPGRLSSFKVEGGAGWRAANRFDLTWKNPDAANGSPVAVLLSEVCPARNAPGDKSGCVSGRRGASKPEVEKFTVPGPGEWTARFWLEDEAGNQNAGTAEEVRLAFDEDAPRLAFLDRNPEDPARISVAVSDPTSAPVRGEIEAQRDGEDRWRSLDTKLEGGSMFTLLDDEALPDGAYALRARVFDQAGNEKSTSAGPDGNPVRVALPVRVKTRLAVGRIKRVRTRRTRRSKRVYRRTLVVRPKTKYGRTVRLSGRLTTPGANGLAGRDIEVAEQLALPNAPWQPIATVRTSKTGRFSYRALRGASRTLRFRYAGTSTIRGRTSDVRLLVRAATSLRANRRSVVNGEDVVFRGRLKGGPLPPTSKLLQLQAFSRGKWLTFATPRADPATGLWSYRYRFAATRGRVRYRFRARVPREGSYPFETGSSKVTRVTVRGL